MLIIVCDFHTRYQQIAMVDNATGELVERRLDHESGKAHTFYRSLSKPVRVGIEATGPLHWFEADWAKECRIPMLPLIRFETGMKTATQSFACLKYPSE